jgi:hypothetical protein
MFEHAARGKLLIGRKACSKQRRSTPLQYNGLSSMSSIFVRLPSVTEQTME